MGQLLGPDFPDRIALAVSGGGDSMALLALAHDWARAWGLGLWVVTVDHGLRADSAAEAAMVARECAALGHPHATLRWHWDGEGNLQDAARRARLDLIDRWRGGIGHVLFAHTRDDVAETFLMRLARGSGVEGLSAMAARRVVMPDRRGPRLALPAEDITRTALPPEAARGDGFTVIRPLLQVSRAELRHHVDTLKVPYVDDPSNADPRFARARTRAAMAGLAAVGIGAEALAETAARLARAAEALRARAQAVAGDVVRETPFGGLDFDRDGFARIERDTQLRLLAAALCWVAAARYRPRAAALETLLDRALAGGGGTLHGAELRVSVARIEVFREHAAVRDLAVTAGAGQPWDGRWWLSGAAIDGLSLRALGDDGWRQLPKDTGPGPVASETPPPPAFHVARTLPAVFDGAQLVAFAPARFGPAHDVACRPAGGTFVASLLSR